jgi:hypothetical protein
LHTIGVVVPRAVPGQHDHDRALGFAGLRERPGASRERQSESEERGPACANHPAIVATETGSRQAACVARFSVGERRLPKMSSALPKLRALEPRKFGPAT